MKTTIEHENYSVIASLKFALHLQLNYTKIKYRKIMNDFMYFHLFQIIYPNQRKCPRNLYEYFQWNPFDCVIEFKRRVNQSNFNGHCILWLDFLWILELIVTIRIVCLFDRLLLLADIDSKSQWLSVLSLFTQLRVL